MKEHRLSSRFEFANVQALRSALDGHNSWCPVPARAILLNPVDHALLGFDDLWGVAVIPDERVRVKGIQLDCEASAWDCEAEIETLLRPADPA